jgi:hypothetical protein
MTPALSPDGFRSFLENHRFRSQTPPDPRHVADVASVFRMTAIELRRSGSGVVLEPPAISSRAVEAAVLADVREPASAQLLAPRLTCRLVAAVAAPADALDWP